jgi:hypothetical protein
MAYIRADNFPSVDGKRTRRRGLSGFGGSAPGYPEGGTPQDIYNAVLANTGDTAQATQEAGKYANYMAGQWNASAWSPLPTAASSGSVSSLFSGNALLYIAGALVLLALLMPAFNRSK